MIQGAGAAIMFPAALAVAFVVALVWMPGRKVEETVPEAAQQEPSV